MNLSKNRLTDFSLIPLFKTIQENNLLNKKLISLDLSYNKIKNEGCNAFSKYIVDQLCSLEYINLEGNNLGNKNCLILINKISAHLNDKLRYLNLGVNLIDDSISENLADLCRNCGLLNVLILYQNSLRNIGAGNVMSELKKHNNIKILDLS
jgi:Ran GTPase-activating protein (RanGAP) involved in mRNA processing and transport